MPTLPGLAADVTVMRDGSGIPHIYGDSITDLARAQGYVHAQERFFEMDVRRHVTAGRLSELVGADGARHRQGRSARMGWRRVAEEELPTLEPQTRQMLQAYADGVNTYLRGRSPGEVAVEYAILGLKLPTAEDLVPPIQPLVLVHPAALALLSVSSPPSCRAGAAYTLRRSVMPARRATFAAWAKPRTILSCAGSAKRVAVLLVAHHQPRVVERPSSAALARSVSSGSA